MAHHSAIILGAGVAGLAAGVQLAAAGHRPLVLESRSFAGGRAYSFREPRTQTFVDNGQHLLMGCYTATFALLAQLGTLHHIERTSRFSTRLRDRAGHTFALDCPQLPAPWHVAAGLLRFSTFGLGNCWRARGLLRDLAQLDATAHARDPSLIAHFDAMSVAAWLDTHGQNARARELLWTPLCLAIMNAAPEHASALPFLAMLREGLTRRDVTQGLAYATRPLSEIFAEPAIAFITAHGGAVHTATHATALTRTPRGIAVTTRNGTQLEASHVISALPPRALASLLDASPDFQHAQWQSLTQWEYAPILNIHVWYDRVVMDTPFVGLIDSPFHWIFNRNTLWNAQHDDHTTRALEKISDTTTPSAQSLAITASASYELAKLSREEIATRAITMLATYLPRTKNFTPLHIQITKELHATPIIAPGSNARRLPTITPFPELLLAGDWTNTGLPATIEGAVRSGVRAAQSLLAMIISEESTPSQSVRCAQNAHRR